MNKDDIKIENINGKRILSISYQGTQNKFLLIDSIQDIIKIKDEIDKEESSKNKE